MKNSYNKNKLKRELNLSIYRIKRFFGIFFDKSLNIFFDEFTIK